MGDWFPSRASGELAVEALLARMACAVTLGWLLGWRPLSLLFGGRPSKPDVAHALLLMTVASMFAMVVIGDSLARAFGVVGLGSFVRFRTAIKEPSDAVLFFAAIGLGMACALGALTSAAVGVAVLSLLLVPRDRDRGRAKREAAAGQVPATITEVVHEVPVAGAGSPGGLRG